MYVGFVGTGEDVVIIFNSSTLLIVIFPPTEIIYAHAPLLDRQSQFNIRKRSIQQKLKITLHKNSHHDQNEAKYQEGIIGQGKRAILPPSIQVQQVHPQERETI